MTTPAKKRSPKYRCSKQVNALLEEFQSDLYVYSGPIEDSGVDQLCRKIAAKGKAKRTNVSLFLTTHGGDAHGAYRLARWLQRSYEKIRLLVAGPCKSAGTLLAVGSNHLAFGDYGELGPLDIQINKPDEIFNMESGLDTLQALTTVTTHAFKSFETYMLELVTKSGRAISTKTASDISSQLVRGNCTPVAAQIDPYRVGEIERQMTIAKAYGDRLEKGNLKTGALERLINDYPSHGFVIDAAEAAELFKSVSALDPAEQALVDEIQGRIVRASAEPLVVDLGATVKEDAELEKEDSNVREQADGGGIQPDAAGKPEAAGSSKPNGKSHEGAS